MQDDFSNSGSRETQENPDEDYQILYFIREDQQIPKRDIEGLNAHFENIVNAFSDQYEKTHHANWEFKKNFHQSFMTNCARHVASELVDGIDFNQGPFSQLNTQISFNDMGTTFTVIQSTGLNGTQADPDIAEKLTM